jgi:nucleoside phosphorylase
MALAACGDGGDDATSQQPLAVLSAFPAELAPLVAEAEVEDTLEIEGRVFRRGEIRGVRVVLGLTGIGLVNAAATTRALLERLAVRGIVVSAVAGSSERIGDVVVPAGWSVAGDGPLYDVQDEWLALAAEIAASGRVAFERCTVVPSTGSEAPVCLAHEPAIVVGGIGHSDDPFEGRPFPCQPTGGDVFGCDVALRLRHGALGAGEARAPGPAEPQEPVAEDMETAAIAREAASRGVPFIAFRAVSDGAGDPLGLPGFPPQFFAYYRLAAHNAAAATAAFLERVAGRAS